MGRGLLCCFDLKETTFQSQEATCVPATTLCSASAGAWLERGATGRAWLVAARGTGGHSGIPQDTGAVPSPGFWSSHLCSQGQEASRPSKSHLPAPGSASTDQPLPGVLATPPSGRRERRGAGRLLRPEGGARSKG